MPEGVRVRLGVPGGVRDAAELRVAVCDDVSEGEAVADAVVLDVEAGEGDEAGDGVCAENCVVRDVASDWICACDRA